MDTNNIVPLNKGTIDKLNKEFNFSINGHLHLLDLDALLRFAGRQGSYVLEQHNPTLYEFTLHNGDTSYFSVGVSAKEAVYKVLNGEGATIHDSTI